MRSFEIHAFAQVRCRTSQDLDREAGGEMWIFLQCVSPSVCYWLTVEGFKWLWWGWNESDASCKQRYVPGQREVVLGAQFCTVWSLATDVKRYLDMAQSLQ